jgi:hypothetical protein
MMAIRYGLRWRDTSSERALTRIATRSKPSHVTLKHEKSRCFGGYGT